MTNERREAAEMINNYSTREPSFEVLKSESARQRWEWFHRAIALAKQSNSDAMRETDEPPQESAADDPGDREDRQLSIAR